MTEVTCAITFMNFCNNHLVGVYGNIKLKKEVE